MTQEKGNRGRGLLLFPRSPYNNPPMESFTSFQTILQGIARQQGFDIKLVEYRLQAQWALIVGEVLSAHTFPSRIRFRKLYVTVENSMWLHQLTFLKKTILDKIHAQIGRDVLTDLIFRVGDISKGETPSFRPTFIHPQVSPEMLMTATECSRVVENQELRNSLTRVIAKALSAS